MFTISLVSRFPQELIDKVIEEIETDDPILHSCALVCRTFLRPSQARSFSHVDLIPTQSARCQRLHQVLLDSPHVCRYVRSLKLVERDSIAAGDSGKLSPVINVLSILDSLMSFTFEVEAGTRDFACMNMPLELRLAICGLCERSSLLALEVSDLGEFAHVEKVASLVASPTLSEIRLQNIVFPPGSELEKVAESRPRATKFSLNLVHHDLTLLILTRWLAECDLSGLHRLYVTWTPETALYLQRILDTSAPTLDNARLVVHKLRVLFPVSPHVMIDE
ncbi:hypothetical protein B0H17DRAFT_1138266 [Mycena rosella]|uniref:F-box domain-containing protein n=1 Tax=Mycena rosella TaxID=1033263 RepID=A0AAD7GA10_MYCRO|nr:hypothetical protein B0H17DRAFT_1138266 [Mycena rosella]